MLSNNTSRPAAPKAQSRITMDGRTGVFTEVGQIIGADNNPVLDDVTGDPKMQTAETTELATVFLLAGQSPRVDYRIKAGNSWATVDKEVYYKSGAKVSKNIETTLFFTNGAGYISALSLKLGSKLAATLVAALSLADIEKPVTIKSGTTRAGELLSNGAKANGDFNWLSVFQDGQKLVVNVPNIQVVAPRVRDDFAVAAIETLIAKLGGTPEKLAA